MKKSLQKMMILIVIIIASTGVQAQTTTIFFDDFNGERVSSLLWHIPTWRSSTDGTYIGRTQFRCSQNAALPLAIKSQAIINVESYNPTGFSFYGTDLISNKSFTPGKGLIITVYAKINSPVSGGIVGGIYFYDLTGSGTIHDEIDFELVTNNAKTIHTNIYSDEPMGAGHPDSVSISTPITEFHKYVIKWLPNEVTWLVDDIVIRKNTDRVPSGPMRFNLNMWVPGTEWPAAYNSGIQAARTRDLNQIFSMIVDSVRIDSLIKPLSVFNIKNAEDINFYPNPAQDLICFKASEKIKVTLYNIAGEVILNKKEILDGKLPLTNLLPGLYIIQQEKDGVLNSAKLIKY